MHVERTFSVPRPVESVFDYLSDFTHTEEWDPGTVSTTRTGGTAASARRTPTSSSWGAETSLTYETITFERPSRLQFRGKNKTATATDSMTFTAPATDRPPRSTTAPTSTSARCSSRAPPGDEARLDTLADGPSRSSRPPCSTRPEPNAWTFVEDTFDVTRMLARWTSRPRCSPPRWATTCPSRPADHHARRPQRHELGQGASLDVRRGSLPGADEVFRRDGRGGAVALGETRDVQPRGRLPPARAHLHHGEELPHERFTDARGH